MNRERGQNLLQHTGVRYPVGATVLAVLLAGAIGIGIAANRRSSLVRYVEQQSFETIAAGFAARFGVPEIRADRLMARLEQGAPTLLVDVREKEEQSISTIPGAVLSNPRVHIGDEKDIIAFSRNHEGNPDARIVLYCAGGYRSARSLSRMPATLRGITLSLHGGIVGFVNAGGRVVDPSGKPVQVVHSYNAMWAAFVQPPYQAVTEPKVR